MKNELKNKATGLRSAGYSFREIGLILNISKSTASVWCRQETVTLAGLERLKKLGDDGRERGKKTIAKKQRILLDKIDKNCGVLVDKKYDLNDYKLFLALLYWCEGSKTGQRLRTLTAWWLVRCWQGLIALRMSGSYAVPITRHR
jgi:hypothetical protein